MTNYPSAPSPYGSPSQPGPGPDAPAGGRPGGPFDQSGPGVEPVCPRHPDRVAYVRCQRCNRPTCPECQRPAPVGVQCVDCVRDAARQDRPQRTVLGGRAAGGNPVVTYTLIGINVAVYVLGLVMPSLEQKLYYAPVFGLHEPWRILTTTFLHAGLLHLAMNMYAIYVIGPFLEKALGRWRYIALYLLAALGGSLAVVLVAQPGTPAWNTVVVGASGAVFGLFGAIGFVLKRFGQSPNQILAVIGINAVISLVVARISWEAHLGGLIIGALMGLVFTRLPKERQGVGGVALVVGVAVALVVGFVVRFAGL